MPMRDYDSNAWNHRSLHEPEYQLLAMPLFYEVSEFNS